VLTCMVFAQTFLQSRLGKTKKDWGEKTKRKKTALNTMWGPKWKISGEQKKRRNGGKKVDGGAGGTMFFVKGRSRVSGIGGGIVLKIKRGKTMNRKG